MSVTTQQTVYPGLAVIIPYYDGAQFIEQCLQTVLESSMLPYHIYIVDNDPEGLSRQSSAFNLANVKVIRTRPAIGFGRAVNIGVADATQDGHTLFLVLNQDTRMDTFCIASMVDTHASAKSPALITAMIYDYLSLELSAHFMKYILKEQTAYSDDLARNDLRRTYSLTKVGAACILFDTRLCSSVGLFDPLFYMYGEDNDLCTRIRHAGGELLLDTRARVHHFHSLIAAEGIAKSKIDSWLAISRILLRIRYAGLSRSGYIQRSILYFFKAIFKPSGKGISPFIFLSPLPRILSDWRALKSMHPEEIKKHIERQVTRDRN